jgi:hypothetical protein
VFPATEKAPIVPAFTADTDAGTLTHTNPLFVKYGGWGQSVVLSETEGKADIPSGQQANFAYVYPVGATGFTLGDWDFAELKLTTTGTVSAFTYKLYPSTDTDAVTGRTGSLVTDTDSTIKLEIGKIPTGLGFQKYTGNTDVLSVTLTEVVYSKGTRHAITFDTDSDDEVAAPTSPAFLVEGTKVGTLPTLTREGYIFLGWALNGTPLTIDTEVDSSFANATLTALWKAGTAYADQTVTFSDANLFAVGNPERLPDGATETVNSLAEYEVIESGAGYEVTTHNNSYGNSWVYFTYEFTDGANLSDFTHVMFKYQGVSGDVGWKTLVVVVMEDTALAGIGDYISFQNQAGNSPIGSYNYSNNGLAEVELELEIDPGKAAALDGKTVGIAIGIHGNDYEIRIADFVFTQQD